MAELYHYIHSGVIIPHMEVKTKEDAVRALVDKIYSSGQGCAIDPEKVCADVMSREHSQTTGVGYGLAFPHARIEGWEGISIVMGICPEGIDFSSPDALPVRVVFLMVSSPDDPYVILKTMAGLVRVFRGTGENLDLFIEKCLLIAHSMEGAGKRIPNGTSRIYASDIARLVKHYVLPQTHIEDVTRMMHLNHLDSLPVVDTENRFLGEVSCLDIFRYGMPNFFSQLQTVSFVRHIDPFEKYFRIKRDLTVEDFYDREVQPVDVATTLVEIVFEMAVRQRSTLYVTDKSRRLTGAIDRFCIVDKILFF